MRKSQTTAFLLLLFYIGKLIFSQKTYLEKKQVIGSAVTPTPMQIFIGFVDAILRSKILCNRLRILTQILIAMDNFIYIFQTSTFNLGKKIILIWAINFIMKSIMKGIKILTKRLLSFSIIVFSMKLLVITFIRKKSICQGIFLVPPIQVTRSVYCGIVFQTMYTSKICT